MYLDYQVLDNAIREFKLLCSMGIANSVDSLASGGSQRICTSDAPVEFI
jgi:hypothetical protein